MKSPQSTQELFEALTELLRARSVTIADEEVPDTGELAAFFYGKSNDAGIARQVALNRAVTEEMALYAKAERAAADHTPRQTEAGVPAETWEMIRRWEENDFAKLKPQTKKPGSEILEKLAKIVAERQAGLGETEAFSNRQVTVVVLNAAGEICGFEKFEKSETRRGDITLKHAEQSERFDNRELHAFSHQSGKPFAVKTFTIEQDKVLVGKFANRNEAAHHTAYFIIDDEI